MNTRSYITTAIPYVNASPHVGFALELTQADATARRHRAAGRTVRFQTGTDENAFKNVEAARAAGVNIPTWVDARSAQFRQLADRLQISYDRFLRTTEEGHARGVHRLWRSLRAGDVFQQGYTGRYFFLRAVPQFGDGNFSADRFAAVYEADLANGLGNLASRLFTLASRSGLEAATPRETVAQGSAFGLELPHDEVLALIWRQIDQLNQELEQEKPWLALRDGSTLKVRDQIAAGLGRLGDIAKQIEPFLPDTSLRILTHLSERPLRSINALFPRL